MLEYPSRPATRLGQVRWFRAASIWAEWGAHSAGIAATVVLQHPNVDGVLGARDVSFQMPLPPIYSGSIRHTGCLRTDQAARPQETEGA